MSDVTDALTQVMEDVRAVAKNDRNTHQNFQFRGIDAVVNAVGPALRDRGVVVVPTLESCTYEAVQTSTGKPANSCRVVVTYTFHKGDSSLACSVAAEAWDNGDKAAPKAMSVAFRTALLQALALPTDEPDPDSHTYERQHTSGAAAGDEPAAPVDLTSLEAAIVVAEDLGLDGKWADTLAYAGRSQAHADKAVVALAGRIESAA